MQKDNQPSLGPNADHQTGCRTQKQCLVGCENTLMDYLKQLLSLQYEVNQILLVNNILAEQFLKHLDQTNGKNSSSQGSTLVSGKSKMPPKSPKRPHQQNNGETKPQHRPTCRHKQKQSQSEYEPSEEQQAPVQYKLSQSKNVPKNYGKSILSFIRKNQDFRERVLNHFDIDNEKFTHFLNKFKNSINTIAELRSLWIDDSGNQFAQVLRVMSWQYLRRHSLGHIFNSRVQNFGKHIKYRKKILKALHKPEQFTQMKDY